MKFRSNKHREGQLRVQPEHTQTAACGTPIANAEVNTTRRCRQGELLRKLWDLNCETLETISKYNYSVESSDFQSYEDYEKSVKSWKKQSINQKSFHDFIHSHHVATSWTEWTTIQEVEK